MISTFHVTVEVADGPNGGTTCEHFLSLPIHPCNQLIVLEFLSNEVAALVERTTTNYRILGIQKKS